MTRKTAREIAIQLGFAAAATGESPQELLDRFFEPEHFASLSAEDELYAQFPDEKQMDYITRSADLCPTSISILTKVCILSIGAW